MATLAGILVSVVGQYLPAPRITDNLSRYALDNWPPHAALGPAGLLGLELNRASAEPNNRRTLSGMAVPSYEADLYHRIHIAPNFLSLGNVVSEQLDYLYIWNAHLTPVTLTGIAGVSDNVMVQGPVEPVAEWPALQEQEWMVNVTPDGPSTIDVIVSWLFSGDESAHLHITGTRIIAWPFSTDWGQPVIESLIWATDILQSDSGAEQRRQLRLSPRREFTGSYLITGRERQLFDATLAGWGARNFALPIVHDVQWLTVDIPIAARRIPCMTEGYDFTPGGLVMLYIDAFNFEVAEIDAIDSTGVDVQRDLQSAWPLGVTRIYPVRPARLMMPPSLQRLSDDAYALEASWLVLSPSQWPLAVPDVMYRDRPVVIQRPEESVTLTHGAQRLLLELDNGTGIPQVYDTADVAFDVRAHRWFLVDDEVTEQRRWLYALAGRLQSVWIPSWASDMTVREPILSSSISIQINNIGYSRFCQGRNGRQDIAIILHTGQIFYRRITASAEIDSDIEVLQLNEPLGQLILLSEIDRISYLMLCRLDNDRVDLRHHTDSQVECEVIFRGVRDDEL